MEKNKYFKMLPNILTIARLFLTILFIILCLNTKMHLAIVFDFLLICFSDIVDGKIARYFNAVTVFGSILDVLVDSFFIFSSLTILCCKEKVVPAWFILLVFINLFVFIITSFTQKDLSTKSKNFFVFDLIGRTSAALFYAIPGIAYTTIYLGISIKIIHYVIWINSALALTACASRLINRRFFIINEKS
ncbi:MULTISPECIES: CDP-alcohol phosphatidyltransferase family protein [Clostridium]|uniref:CDP-alcohol phosphatidyltransferase family protein n=1 Tax=Clostridium TaxID=1485 RepID=UPI00069E9144|nr:MULTISPECIES: CDP-alcohol phosphatidyltransferase family protein [Clostridium]MCD2345586.1 CDP-alcohol phosphatidyltransferase family protein [Clostridium guangxiense]